VLPGRVLLSTTQPNFRKDGLKMKNLVNLSFVALLFLAGCSGSKGIVGVWDSGNGKYEFFADGTYLDPRYSTLPRENMKYRLEGGMLHLSVRETFLNRESTSSQEWAVKFIDNDTLDVEGERWKRVK
jgi:hypothetical protein